VSTRITRSTVHFAAPFLVDGFEARLPAGDYRVEHDEEMIPGISWLAWRRIASFIRLPAVGAASLVEQVVQVDPAALDAALERDREQAPPTVP
jgi:hypothetical protein